PSGGGWSKRSGDPVGRARRATLRSGPFRSAPYRLAVPTRPLRGHPPRTGRERTPEFLSMNVITTPSPDFMLEEEITLFSDSVGKWIDEHAPPEAVQTWIANSTVPRQLWNDAGEAGLLGLSMPEEDGGMGGDYRHEV